MTHKQQVKQTTEFLKSKGILNAQVGIILGTGLGNLATKIDPILEISYQDIPNFPLSTVEFHSGKLIYGNLGGKKVLALQGRFHFYEGYSMQEITFPVRVLKLLGVSTLFISNAAGAINLSFSKGDLMLVTDHINLLPSPLHGANVEEWGTRFPDMSQPYNNKIGSNIVSIASENEIVLRKGTYVSVQGPMLETAAEYRQLGILGADAVGMSTVPEVIVANHMNLPCVAISVLTDECDPDNLKPIDIQEIIAVAGKAEKKLTILFEEAIRKLEVREMV